MTKTVSRVIAISPQEVLRVEGDEQKDVDETIHVMNGVLFQNFDGKTLEVEVPRKLRCALLSAVASRYRTQGWGVKVCYDERKLIFWLDKRTKVKLEGEVTISGEELTKILSDADDAIAIGEQDAG